ncbi:MAG TPA: AI-2E family transporter [Candidatus Polarisedimenticolia bacterium]|jgi:predicted PurR-regulated permease PerM|nr:AI-2E family transporter [Candidatus Polarisedimenticolia bacterium]
MPPWLWKAALLVIGMVAAAYAAFVFVRQIRSLIIWLIAALFLSFALEPAVNWLVKHGWRRGLATLAVLLALVLMVAVLIASMVPLVLGQVQSLIEKVPEWLDKLAPRAKEWFNIDISTAAVLRQIKHLNSDVKGVAQNVAGNVLGFGTAILGAIFELATIALFTFYFVADGPRMRRTICSTLPPRRQREVLFAWEVGIDKTGGYLYSRLLLGAISATCFFILLKIIGVPFAVPLALWMGVVSQFVPVVGTYIAAALPLLVAVLVSPVDALIVLIYVLVYQQVENYLLAPKISAHTMQLHPAVAFGAAICGASVGGAVGAFLALPAAAIIQGVGGTYIRRHEVVDTELTQDAPNTEAAKPGMTERVRARLSRRGADEDSPQRD